MNDNNYSQMWIASLVRAHDINCLQIVSFMTNTHLQGIFNHSASKSMHNWDVDHILLVSFFK